MHTTCCMPTAHCMRMHCAMRSHPPCHTTHHCRSSVAFHRPCTCRTAAACAHFVPHSAHACHPPPSAHSSCPPLTGRHSVELVTACPPAVYSSLSNHIIDAVSTY